MKLISSLTSPYGRKVRVVLAEKNIEYTLQVDLPWAADNHASRHNPLGKQPVLLLDDGTTVYDSRVIVEHLDATVPHNRLIPESGRERMLVRRWEALGDGLCDAAISILLEKQRPEAQRNPDWIERQRMKIEAGLMAMEQDLVDCTWCVGARFSLADIAVGAFLDALTRHYPEYDLAVQNPHLKGLHDRTRSRPSFVDTAAPQ